MATQPAAKKTAANKTAAAAAEPDPMVVRDPIWAHLARPFDADWIEKLPRNVKKNDDNKGRCENTPASRRYSADGYYCGGWHARSLHLDYVGHAGITMRLNEDVGPENWTLEPLAFSPTGLPQKDGREFWVRLTILGTSKIDVAESFSNTQEAWGDGLRRAAMRFGIGTELWSKSDHAFARRSNAEQAQETPQEDQKAAEAAGPAEHVAALRERLAGLSDDQRAAVMVWWRAAALPKIDALSPEQATVVNGEVDRMLEVQAEQLLKERLGAQAEPETVGA